jgi:hypothetical protein
MYILIFGQVLFLALPSMREKVGFRPLQKESLEVEWVEEYNLRGKVDRMRVLSSPRKKVKLTPGTPALAHKHGDSPQFPSYDTPLEPLRYHKVYNQPICNPVCHSQVFRARMITFANGCPGVNHTFITSLSSPAFQIMGRAVVAARQALGDAWIALAHHNYVGGVCEHAMPNYLFIGCNIGTGHISWTAGS